MGKVYSESSPMAQGPFTHGGDLFGGTRVPGLVIEQYALLCEMKVRPLMLCLCFISTPTKKEAPQTATFTPLLAAPLSELKHFPFKRGNILHSTKQINGESPTLFSRL